MEAVLDRQTPMLLITGETGVGKSELLRATQEQTESEAAPAPITVSGYDGSLQRSLLQGLADATAGIVEQRGAAGEFGQKLAAAMNRLASDRAQGLAKVVGQAFLSKVKEKVGAGVVELFSDYLHDLADAEHDTLLARIHAATDPDIADSILDLAGEVAALAGPDTPIVIALDAAEHLTHNDRGLLAALAQRLPTRVYLRVAFGTYTEQHQAHVEDFRSVGESVAQVHLQGITREAVRQWLEAEGHDPWRADDVYRSTDGYPLFVRSAIDQLAVGEDIGDAEPTIEFRARTQQAWSRLDAQAQAVARQLAVFDQPLPEVELQKVCGLGSAEWGTVVERLQRANVLSGLVNGVPWFHPLRRQLIHELLRESERGQLMANAAAAYLSYAEATNAPQLTTYVALLAGQSPLLLEQNPQMRAASELDRQQLSVAAALLDTFEPSSHLVNANHVLQHARDFFAGQGDLVPSVEVLAARGLLAPHTGPAGGLSLEPTFDRQARAVIQGRALLELGRLPLPGLVSSVFQAAITPRLQFVHAVYGLGVGNFRESVEIATRLNLVSGRPVGRGTGYFLLLRVRFHDRALGATVQFASAELRDEAVRQLEGLSLDLLGGQLEVEEVIPHPGDAAPADRFVNAAERALRRDISRVGGAKLEMAHPYDADEFMDLRVKAFEFVRSRCSDAERRAYGIEQTLSIHWHLAPHGDRESLLEGQVLGGEPRAIRHDDVSVSMTDPYHFFRLAEAFGLGEGERLTRLHVSSGQPRTNDPVIQVLEELRVKALAVNRHQAQLRVPIAADALAPIILDARERELSDARALVAEVPLDGEMRAEPQPQATYLCLHRRADQRGPLSCGVVRVESESGTEEVHVSNEHLRGGSWEDAHARFSEAFGRSFDMDSFFVATGDATQFVADLLGHDPGDILLVEDGGHPADAW